MNNNSTINLKINNNDFTATLEDNKTVKRLLEEFPLEITMNDLNNNEKYFYLDQNLPTNTKHIDKINTGDIMLYGNNCLVIFYDTFNTSYSYTKIGHINNLSSLEEVVGNNDIKVVLSK